MNNLVSILLATFFGFLFSYSSLHAQTDAHYWTHQFGAKGLLLNGAVIASTEDETAVFYNPGAMTSDDGFSLSLSFLTPAYSILKTQNFLGSGNTVTDKSFGFAPGLGSLGFHPFDSKKVRMAITSFTRYKSNISFRGRVVNEVANDENAIFVGNLEFNRSMNERWFGAGMSYKITDYFSLGFSQFVTFHSESSNFSIQKELVNKNEPTELFLGWRNRLKYSFSTKGGMLTKFGILLRIERIKIGATLTTPTYNNSFLKGASYDYDDLKTFGQDSTVLISNFDGADLKAYKTPLSIGFGMDFPFKKTHLSFSVEFFKGIDTYTIIEDADDPFDGIANNSKTRSLKLIGGNRPVVNIAIGGETQLSKKFSLIWGFRTDFNQRELTQGIESQQFLSTTPNVYHISIGNSFEIWSSKFSYGFDYGFGKKQDNNQLVDFSNINTNNLFDFISDGRVTSSFQSINFILAYDFTLRKKNKKKNEEE